MLSHLDMVKVKINPSEEYLPAYFVMYRCKALDSTADGYVRAEACAVIVLGEPVADTTLALLSATAVNQDGRCVVICRCQVHHKRFK